MLIKDVRARYSKGSLVPLQPLDIKEGEVVTIRSRSRSRKTAPRA